VKTFTKAPLQRHVLNGATMGTRYSATFYGPDDLDTELIAEALFVAVDRVDRQMSTWKPESDLNRLNGAPIGKWVEIPRELGLVLAAGLRIGRLSGGVFDMAVGDLVAMYGFGASPGAPDPATSTARAGNIHVSAGKMLELAHGNNRARRLGPVSLDLSGIAKGFGVDELARALNRFDIDTWLVGIDGEMRARGVKPDRQPWAIAVERPEAGLRAAMGVLTLADAAVATSGSYRQFRDGGNGRVSHTMDPRSGFPLNNKLVAVTVLAETCMEADALATALLVMGDEAGPKMAQALGVKAIFVLEDGRVLSNLP
jgi:FAD:protein FMN transferase